MDRLEYKLRKQHRTPAQQGGIGCLTVLTLIFITLKLTDNIDWSWWWVLSPMIFQAALIVICIAVLYALGSKGRW